MRIAIFHDFLGSIGGAEKAVAEIAKELDDATIITTNLNRAALEEINASGIKVIDLGRTPDFFPLKHASIFLKFFMCDYSRQFDFFIFSGNRSIFASWRHKPNVWYCHSPERAVFDLYPFYKKILPLHEKLIFIPSAFFFKTLYKSIGLKGVQSVMTNSANTRKRIKSYLNKDASINYPPIDTKKFSCRTFGGYWLSVNRFYPAKRVELQLDAFRLLPGEKLVIAGSYLKGDVSEPYFRKISGMLPPNVSILGCINEKKLHELYSNCRGFIATAIDEDFGMTVVEAMASGKAVVAVNEGGFRETIIDGKTGFLVEANAAELAKAVRVVSKNPGRYKKACIAQARKFDSGIFFRKLEKAIQPFLLPQKSPGKKQSCSFPSTLLPCKRVAALEAGLPLRTFSEKVHQKTNLLKAGSRNGAKPGEK